MILSNELEDYSKMKQTLARVIILLVLYVCIPILFTALYFVGNLFSLEYLFSPFNLSIIAGALAYIFFMSQFLIAARIRFLEQIFGQDRLLSMHGYLGFVSGALVLAHFVLKYVLILQYGFVTFQSALGFAAMVIFAFLAPLAYFILQGRKQKLGPVDYEKAKISHNLFALAGLLAVFHVYLATSTWSVMWPLVLRIFIVGWGVLTLGTYVWHKMIRPRKNLAMRLVDKAELAPGVHQYRFEPIADISEKGASSSFLTKRLSGQFAYFRFEGTAPISDEHPFTFSSPADEDIAIIVRDSGDFSGQMSHIPLGTQVKLDGPYGKFHPYGIPAGTPLLFMAGGIGVTPFISMARDKDLRKKYPITLVWSIPSPEDEPVVAPLAELARAEEISLKMFYTRKAPEGIVPGRINGSVIAEILKELPEGKQQSVACFLCGPGRFVRDMSGELRKQGIGKSQIHSESFSW